MQRILGVLAVVAATAIVATAPAAAQDAIGRAFSEALFKEEQITRSVREHPDVSGMSKDEMNAALQARAELAGFFGALSAGSSKFKEYLSPALSGRYADANTLRRERFGAETYLSFEIFDFRVNENLNRVKFRYFLAENDQGNAMIRQRAITFDRNGGAWKISEFDNFDFD